MGNIDWDDSPNAGDCYTTATWNNMITYIKHSAACVFTIFDDDASTSQKFKFSYSGNNSVLEGDDTATKHLVLKANSANIYPYIDLVGNADIVNAVEASAYFYVFHAASQSMKIIHTAGQVSVYGGDTTGDKLAFASNNADVRPIFTLSGNSSVYLDLPTDESLYIQEAGTTFMRVISTVNGSEIMAVGANIPLVIETAANGDIWFSPGGTGKVRFGVYSALGVETLQGFITIKDDAGNLRKVAIVA